ncbi:MAG: tail protein X, partial [Plesiomonas shigelloides]
MGYPAFAGASTHDGGADLVRVRAMQHDTVDALCWRYYGRTRG